jgi:hypothetical protein
VRKSLRPDAGALRAMLSGEVWAAMGGDPHERLDITTG